MLRQYFEWVKAYFDTIELKTITRLEYKNTIDAIFTMELICWWIEIQEGCKCLILGIDYMKLITKENGNE